MSLYKQNTISDSRELAAQVQVKLVPGRRIVVAGKGQWITVDGTDHPYFVQFMGGGRETVTRTFNSRKELCDYLRDQL